MDMEWLGNLRGILGELATLERRLQSQPESVSNTELISAAEKVDKLKAAGPPGPQSGPWDVFYRKYSAMLHPHLEERGLSSGAPSPPAWDFNKALAEVMDHVNESEIRSQTSNSLLELSRVVQQLESGEQVSDQVVQRLLDQMDEIADGVLELAPEHPEVPPRFERLRKRLLALVETRG
jgi:hypothetical protein